MFDRTTLISAVEALGGLLATRGEAYELVAIGGGTLILRGWTERPTKDLDIVAQVVEDNYVTARPFPPGLTAAVEDIARLRRLAADWMNPGPTDQLRFGLPPGFRERVTTEHHGGLTLHLAGRLELICLKIFAATDDSIRGKHFLDLVQLMPTDDELAAASEWVKTQDGSPVFAEFVEQVIAKLVEVRRGAP
jgi:hypothetical protein